MDLIPNELTPESIIWIVGGILLCLFILAIGEAVTDDDIRRNKHNRKDKH